VGGNLIDLGGNVMIYYSWGLGTTTNNITEAYPLYAGLKLAKECNISQLSVFGDSILIVMVVLKISYMENNLLSGILH
jgi:ribonuclease HI